MQRILFPLLLGALLLGALLLGVAAPAEAQRRSGRDDATPTRPAFSGRDGEARAHFDAGLAAYRAGHFADAERDFRRAYELSGRAELLYDIGTAAERANHDEAALTAYQQFLQLLPRHAHRARVEVRIRALREIIAERAEAEAREAAEAEAESARAEAASPSATADASDATPAWAVFGVSLAIAAGGGAMLLVSQLEADAVRSAPQDSRWADVSGAYGRVEPFAIAGVIMLSVGLAGAVLGLSWALLTPGPADSPPAAVTDLRLDLGLGGLRLRGAFH